MKLLQFRVRDFRSIKDSDWIDVHPEAATALVGRNESGKSALLRALQSLKPPGGSVKKWGLARDFPRDRKRSEFEDSITMLETKWALSPEEQRALVEMRPALGPIQQITVSRDYAGQRHIGYVDRPALLAFVGDVSPVLLQVSSQLKDVAAALAEEARPALQKAIAALPPAGVVYSPEWAKGLTDAVSKVRAALTASQHALSEDLLKNLDELAVAARRVTEDAEQAPKAREWITAQMPTLVYLDDWEIVPGHHNVPEYLGRKGSGKLTRSDQLFEKLLKVAELDAKELHGLLGTNHEERKLLTNRAETQVTRVLRRLWKDREIDVHFDLDGDHFNVTVRDRDSNAIVPLEERSRGFQWYFSFFITFAADTHGGSMDDAILLLDEPGLFLHALAQEALLDYFDQLENQIVYSTHSPFMIDPRRMDAVRTVTLDEDRGTVVSSTPSGDARTLFPLQSALGYNLTQTMFVGTENIVVEGVTDFWFLSVFSEHLRMLGETSLPESVVLTPAGGAAKVGYMVALLASQRLDLVVLLDSDKAGDEERSSLLQAKLVRDKQIVRVSVGLDPAPSEADVEDLLDPAAYVALVEEAYKKELKGKTLTLNPKIPRIVKRIEAGFDGLGLEFNKTRVARLFLTKAGGKQSSSVITPNAIENFSRVFSALNAALRHVADKSATKPFQR